MTVKQKKVLFNKHQALASITKRSFWRFCQEFWEEIPGSGILIANWHMEVICNELQDIAERIFRGEKKKHDLIINVSPGASKSSICSILYPAWLWTRKPDTRVISSSHTDDLVLDLANKSRNVIKSDLYQACFPDVRIREDQDTKGYYANSAGGDRKTCTIAGKSPTGFHAHILLCDDPIDPKKAISDVELKTARYFYDSVIPSRKVNKEIAVEITIMQRLHVNDPTGHLLERSKLENTSPIKHICLPAELTEEAGKYSPETVIPVELAKNYKNGLMDPKRIPREVLKRERATMGAYAYAGQYLQSPIPLTGGLFSNHYFNQRVKAAPYDARRIRYWDRACLLGYELSQITTKEGIKPIEEVTTNDHVMTRKGWKPVLFSGETKQVDQVVAVLFSNGSVVSGTPDHRIWIENKKVWKNLVCLTGNDTVVTNSLINEVSGDSQCLYEKIKADEAQKYNQIPNTLNLMGSGIGKKEKNTTKQWSMTDPQEAININHSIEKSGNIITEISPKVMISITRMETSIIIQSQILSVYPEKNIIEYTINLPISTEQKNLKSIISELVKLFGKTQDTKNIVASNVTESFNQEQSAIFQNTALKNAVSVIVLKFVENKTLPVYDLTVKDEPEFLVNDILVHNSTDGGGCYTAGVLLAKDREGNYYVEDLIHGQWEPHERNMKMRATALKDRHKYGKHEPVIWVEAEGGSSGRDAWKGVVRALAGFVVKEDRVSGSKEVRAEPWSAQLAAGNVYLVENGLWPINTFIEEHCAFPLGKTKDIVDSSTGAFNRLVGVQVASGILRTFTFKHNVKKQQMQVIACNKEEIENLVVEPANKALLIVISDPDPVGSDDLPLHGIASVDSSLVQRFTSHNPAEYQESWEDLIAPYDKSVGDIMMFPSHGKAIWSFIRRQRQTTPNTIVICDMENDNRAISIAHALVDGLKWEKSCIHAVNQDKKEEKINQHVYDVTKLSRLSVL